MNELFKAMDFINDHRDFYIALNQCVFEPMICMLMEEYCKANHLDMVAEMRNLLTAAEQVNEELGAY